MSGTKDSKDGFKTELTISSPTMSRERTMTVMPRTEEVSQVCTECGSYMHWYKDNTMLKCSCGFAKIVIKTSITPV